jgi:arsenite methyltransferase
VSHEIDCWARWLLHTRFRGPHGKDALDFLTAIRDRVLDRALLRPGDVVLDVGSGDGLLAFGALHRVAPNGLVIIDDISQDLLDACLRVACEAGVEDRLRLLRNNAANLCDVADASIDAVLLRSVLLYVPDKAVAAAEFRRVLRPGGRLSIFEPIGRLSVEWPRFGIDPGPVADLAARVEQAFRALQPPETGPMLDFDERDLLHIFEQAGFDHLELELQVRVKRERKSTTWFDALLAQPSNPRIPSLRQAIEQALQPGEAATYLAYYRQAISTSAVVSRQALAYLCGSVEDC